jgi:hypothetical protein
MIRFLLSFATFDIWDCLGFRYSILDISARISLWLYT